MRRHWLPFLCLPALVVCLVGHAAEVVTVLNDFESALEIDRFAGRLRYVYVSPSAQFKTSGGYSCEARFFTDCCSEGDTYIRSIHSQGDYAYKNWSVYQQFAMDVYNPQAEEMPLRFSFSDSKKKAEFRVALNPAAWTPVRIRIAELKAKGLDVSNVADFAILQELGEMRRPNRLFLDNARLIGEDRAAIEAAKKAEDATSAERKRKLPERGELAEIVPRLSADVKRTIRLEKNVPIVYETDVVVVGGGFAGTAAAVAAAREGAKVLLIERAGCLGGMATSGLVPPAMNLAVTEGMARELDSRCMEKGGPAQNRNPEIIKQVLYDMVVESGAKLMLYTLATGAVVEKDAIKGVFIESKSGTQAVLGKVVVDCTGDGDIAASAGAPFEIGRGRDEETQCVTLVFLLGNVDTTRFFGKDVDLHALFREAKVKGDLTAKYSGGAACAAVVKGKHGVINVNSVNIPLVDGLKPADLTYAQLECHKQILELHKFFQKCVPGCEESYVLSTAAWMGVRETRRIIGEYVLTGEDILSFRSFPDAIARGFYPVDIHVADGTGDAVGMHPMAGYDIPYRSLVPKKIENLLVAGRCASADHIAHGSIRVMGTTIALGEAAGYAAALALRDNVTPRQLDVNKLQATLKTRKALPDVTLKRVPDNLALSSRGTKATADSAFRKGSAGYAPVGAIDGYDSLGSGSRWLSDDTPEPHWLMLDFGSPKTFEFVRLRFWSVENKDDSPNYFVQDYSIQIEKAGAWQEVAVMKGNKKRVTEHKFPPVTAQRVRFNVTKACAADRIVRLREIEVHEKAPIAAQ